MSRWALTIWQVEAGYALYRWRLVCCYTGEVIKSERGYSSVADAEESAVATLLQLKGEVV